jgi:glycosyltransferase involved in cell wall biosynthesis
MGLPVHVLQVHNEYRERGGEDSVVAAEAELLRAAGHEVVQHLVQNPSSDPEAMRALAMSTWNPNEVRAIEQLARSVRPDVAHVHNTWYSLSPAVLRTLHRAGVPVVMTLHNYRLMCVNAQLFRDGAPCEDCVGTHPWRGVAHRCYRDSMLTSAAVASTIQLHRMFGTWERDVDMFLVLTEFAKQRFIASGLPEHKLRVKPNFAPDPGERPAPPSQSNRVLFVGRLSAEKGVDVLLDAWRDVPTDLELVIVGDGPLRPQLEAAAPPGVHFAGALSPTDVQHLMLTSRAITIPSAIYEGQPMVQLEAFAAGLPMIVSNHGGTAETLGTTQAGLTAQPGNPTAWTHALTQLTDDTLTDHASTAARTTYLTHYNPTTALTNLTTIYREACALAYR